MVRIRYAKVEPEAYNVMRSMQDYVSNSGLDRKLMELIKIRCSQINGCAYCLDMHTQDAIALGEEPRRIFTLSAWRDSPFYTDAERAALELSEAVTRISEGGVPDSIFESVMKHFTEAETVKLLMCINTINCWNRLSISCGFTAGMYNRENKK